MAELLQGRMKILLLNKIISDESYEALNRVAEQSGGVQTPNLLNNVAYWMMDLVLM